MEELYSYQTGGGVVESLDPRFKILSFLFLAWAIALSSLKESLAFLPAVLLLSLPLIKRLRELWKTVLFADSFLLLVVLSQLFLGSPQVALEVFVRSNLILLLSLSLLTTTPTFELLHALHHLKVPNSLLQVAFLTYRYLHEVKERYLKSLKSAKCRGFSPRTDSFTYKTYASVIGSLITYSFLKADRVYKAMECRGFSGYFPVFRHFKATAKDFIFLAASITYGALVLWKF